MSDITVLALAREMMQTALLVAAPMLVAALAIGMIVSIFQVATSIQDITLVFIPKIVAVAVAFLLAFHWILSVLVAFTVRMFRDVNILLG